MKIVKERTRLLITEFTPMEKNKIDDLVGTMDKVLSYEDKDKQLIGLPTGMEKGLKQLFPSIHIEDHSKSYWEFAYITPVKSDAQPRNQLQIDFIKFVLEQANKKQKLAGILSPGTGKGLPLSTRILTPYGKTTMGDIKVGDMVVGSDGKPTKVLGVFPQGNRDVYRITLIDGRHVLCDAVHLWTVKNVITDEIETLELCRLLRRHYKAYSIPVGNMNTWVQIDSIVYEGNEPTQCIYVDALDHMYMIDQDILTHNTFMACYSALRVKGRTLIIAPTSGIKVQWAETLTDMFGVDPSKVKLINKPSDLVNFDADFAVVSQASLAVLNNRYDLEAILRDDKFGIKVIDEMQMWFHNIIKVDANSNICHNWYLTGTFGRSGDEENALYQQMFGDLAIFREKDKKPTIFNRKPGNIYGMKPHMHVKMMWADSGLSKEEIKSVMGSMRYSERAGKWMRYGISIPAYTKLIIPDDGTLTKFLRILLSTIKTAETSVKYGRTLILGSTINSVEIVAQYVRKLFPDKIVSTYHSRNTKEDNAKAKEECDILLSTTSSCGTGFDMKDLSKLVVFAQYKSWILTDQISGRLRRRPDEKDTYMWDVVDSAVPQLRAWANARADVEKRKAKTFKVVDVE